MTNRPKYTFSEAGSKNRPAGDGARDHGQHAGRSRLIPHPQTPQPQPWYITPISPVCPLATHHGCCYQGDQRQDPLQQGDGLYLLNPYVLNPPGVSRRASRAPRPRSAMRLAPNNEDERKLDKSARWNCILSSILSLGVACRTGADHYDADFWGPCLQLRYPHCGCHGHPEGP